MKIIHIGFGKSGSTWLQNSIFPILCKEKNTKLIDLRNYWRTKKIKFKISPLEIINSKKLPNKFLITEESIVCKFWEHDNSKKSFNIIKNKFDRNTIIIMVIRKPSDFLRSLFIQRSYHELNFLEPSNFFILEKNKNKKKYNLKNFNYEKIIRLYKSYFKNVYVFENNDKKKIYKLKKIFKIKKNLKFKKVHLNKNTSYSSNIINFLIFLNKFINIKKINDYFYNKIKLKPKNHWDKIFNTVYYLFTFERNIPILEQYLGNKNKIEINFGNKKKMIEKLDCEYLKLLKKKLII